MPFTNYAIETFISVHVTAITECRLTDLQNEFPNSSTWVSTFGLSVIFNNHPPEQFRPFVLQFLRRTEMAIAEHHLMRAAVLDLLGGTPRWSPYYRALHHGEASASMLYQAYDFAHKKLGRRMFEPTDGTPLQRLNLIYGTLKHQLAAEKDPVWLSNDGFSTEAENLAFHEFEELLRECAGLAEGMISNRPPVDQPSDE